jgi:CBS-domain-containing membrane protein
MLLSRRRARRVPRHRAGLLAGGPAILRKAKARRKTGLHKGGDKRKALEMMNAADAQVLPVLDEAGRFDGIVDRSKLTASILTEIAQRVEK